MFERYYREPLSFLSRKVPDRATTADLAQESYARDATPAGNRQRRRASRCRPSASKAGSVTGSFAALLATGCEA